MTVAHGRSEELLAELAAEALRQHSGAVGVIVRDVLSPNPTVLLRRLAAMHAESGFPELRIAYLQPGGESAANEVALDAHVFSAEVEQAERWRNERSLDALIVVIARGDEAKLSSLEDFGTVTSQDLKRALVDRAMGGPVGDNDVQAQLWEILGKDKAVGLGQLVDYFISLEGVEKGDFKTASWRELHRVGLLPDPTLLEHRKAGALRRRIESNREVVKRLQILTPKDRRVIKEVVASETDQVEKAKLLEALDQLHQVRAGHGAFGFLDYDQAQRLVKVRTKRSGIPNGKRPRRPVEPAENVAAETLIGHTGTDDLGEVLKKLSTTLASAEATSVRTERIRTQFGEATTEAVSTARLDVVNLVAKILDDGVYGGLIQVDLEDLDDVLRRFNVQEHVVSKWKRDEVEEILSQIAEVDSRGQAIADRFRAYDAARNAILPYMRVLVVEPLVVAADAEARKKLIAAVRAYEGLTQLLGQHHGDLFEIVGSDIDELVGRLLLIDLIVIRGSKRTITLLSPVHPLFVWHYATYADVVSKQHDRLDEKDKRLVVESAHRLPNFLTSLYVPAAAFGEGKSLTYGGRVSQLPYYSDSVQGNVSEDGVRSVSGLFAGYVALEPHARHGFRVALIDPPNAGIYLRAIMDLREKGIIEGAHVVVYRHRPGRLAVELRLDTDDEDRVARLFQASNVGRRFTFEVRDAPADQVGPQDNEPFHVAVVFDRSGGRTTRARSAAHPIQPLAVPRRLHYSTVHKTVELEPSSGGLFKSYQSLVGRIAEGSGQAAYLAVHQQRDLRKRLDSLARRVAWTVVADRRVDRDLSIGALRIFTASEGDRDVAAFARSEAAFRRPLREVARRYNTFITPSEIDDLLRRLSDLLDSGLLNVKPDHTGHVNESRIKGLLATLIAARWYRRDIPPGTRLLVSLDSIDARRWMHLSDDPLRADLVGFEWAGDCCTVTVIEVKSVEEKGREYRIDKGVVSGPAVEQMLATRRLLGAILSHQREDELITTPARREVLREHLYRELTKNAYSPKERRLWSDRLQRLLGGEVKFYVGCNLIDVRFGIDTSRLRERNVVAKDGEESVATCVRELNEEVIENRQEPKSQSRRGPDQEKSVREEVSKKGTHRNKTPAARLGPDSPQSRVADRHELTPDVAVEPRKQPTVVTGDTKVPSEETRPRVLIGTAPGSYGKPRDVWFDPNLPGQELPNPHISVTGETGSGKTQATKAVVSELRAQGIPALVLDFKDDYSNEAFIDKEGFQLYDASFTSLPLNPLIPGIDKRRNVINPAQHVYQVADIIKRIYKLGDQQAFRLREAIKSAYEQTGISLNPGALPRGKHFPAFDTVQEQLVKDRMNEPLLGRLSPIFDLGLFAVDADQSGLDDFFETSAVIRLAQLPGDEVKNSVAEFFLMALYSQLIRQPQVHRLGRLLVLDEAWRVMESPFLTPLMREGRAFGLGVVVATQFPRDLPEAVRGSTATRLFFSQGQVEQVREIQRTIVGKTSGPEAEHVGSVVRGLTPLSCLMHSTQYTPFVRVSVTPYFRRQAYVETS